MIGVYPVPRIRQLTCANCCSNRLTLYKFLEPELADQWSLRCPECGKRFKFGQETHYDGLWPIGWGDSGPTP